MRRAEVHLGSTGTEVGDGSENYFTARSAEFTAEQVPGTKMRPE